MRDYQTIAWSRVVRVEPSGWDDRINYAREGRPDAYTSSRLTLDTGTTITVPVLWRDAVRLMHAANKLSAAREEVGDHD